MTEQALIVEQWPIDRLIPYARNPRVIPEEAISAVAGSLKEFGFRQPIVVTPDAVIVAGHTRFLAARRLGMETVPVHVASSLTPEQAKAYRLLDNRAGELSSWDPNLLNLELAEIPEVTFGDLGGLFANMPELEGFDVAEPEHSTADAEPQIDRAEELNQVWQVKARDLWTIGPHRLLCGDCTKPEDVQRLMGNERAALFATDPPYLVDYDGTNHPRGNKDWSESYGITWDDADAGTDLYQLFIARAKDHAIRENAAWYCWHASRRQAMVEAEWNKAGAFVHQQIIWVKNRPVMVRMHYLWQHEPCFFGWVKPNRPPKVSDEFFSTVWAIPGLERDERPDHPTPKPVECFAIPIRQHVAPGGLCYEPFAGSGTQLVAAQQLGRRCYGIEVSPAYCAVILQRMKDAFPALDIARG